jgi:hypothetical protein
MIPNLYPCNGLPPLLKSAIQEAHAAMQAISISTASDTGMDATAKGQEKAHLDPKTEVTRSVMLPVNSPERGETGCCSSVDGGEI